MYGRFVLRSARPLSRSTASGRGHRRRRDGRAQSTATNTAESVTSNASHRPAGNGQWLKWTVLPPIAAALLGSVAAAFHQRKVEGEQAETEEEFRHNHYEASKKSHPWVNQIAEDPSMQLVLTAEALMKSDHPFLEDDHMFSAFVGKGIVDDIHGFYSPQDRKFSSIISLGREVCGFPRVVHGGLTAAIIDESFGGLLFALRQQKALSFWGPAYTVALEVQYKSKIAAGSTVLCTTEVESMEGRKLWMRATVSDGPDGKVFATARALFVAPKPHKMASDVAKYLFRRAFPQN